jgi:hypothetical protein
MKKPAKQMVTSVILDLPSRRILRELANLRAERLGGRVSQSAVVRALLEDSEAKEKACAPSVN